MLGMLAYSFVLEAYVRNEQPTFLPIRFQLPSYQLKGPGASFFLMERPDSMDSEGQQVVCSEGSAGDLYEETETVGNKDLNGIDNTVELNQQIEKLSIAEQEDRRVVAIEDEDIEETNKDISDSLACKVLTSRLVPWEVFYDIMPRIWDVEGRISMEK